MSSSFYAMDKNFHSSLGNYSIEARCEILAELGYDGLSLTLWNESAWQDLCHVPKIKQRYDLNVVSLLVMLELGTSQEVRINNERILHLLETIEGTATLEFGIRAKDESASATNQFDEELRGWPEKYLVIAEKRHIDLLLYPHISFYLERLEQASSWCRKLDHPHLGITFSGFHWFALDDPKLLNERLADIQPFLRGANICGSRKPGQNGMPATIEPLDEGELDNFAVLAALQRIGYQGPVGLNGYGVGGDVYIKLKRSLEVYRSMLDRLSRHSHWGALCAEDL